MRYRGRTQDMPVRDSLSDASPKPPRWQALLAMGFSVASAIVFAVVMVWIAVFLTGLLPMRSVDGPIRSSPARSALVNTAWLMLFALQHSIMARPAFKRLWLRLVPAPIERSVFVLLSSTVVGGLLWHFEPMGWVVWTVNGGAAAAIWVLFAIAAIATVVAVVVLGGWEYVGLEQARCFAHGRLTATASLRRTGIHAWVRHPMLLAVLLAFWVTPSMTAGHLLLAGGLTLYGVIGSMFEERDLAGVYGDTYRRYQREVPMLIPRPPRALRRDPGGSPGRAT
jgi:protein-S-isoprenylcysteine O-methyltransferase Ste14